MRTANIPANTESHWQRRHAASRASAAPTPLIGAASVDAVVIGGGIGGLVAALTLRHAGASVIVLEAGSIGDGGSSNGTGLVAPPLRHWRATALRRLPPMPMKRLARRLATSATEVRKIIDAEGLPVASQSTGLAVLRSATSSTTAPDDDLAQWHDLDAGVTVSDGSTPVGGNPARPARIWRDAFSVDPSDLVLALADRCRAIGVRIHTGTPALGYGRGGLRWVVTAPEGRLDARALFVATGPSAEIYSHRIMPEVLESVAITDRWYLATTPLAPHVRAAIMPDDSALAIPDGDLQTLAWSSDGALMMALSPGMRRGEPRARNSAMSALAGLAGEAAAREIERSVACIWRTPAALTPTRLPQFHAIGPDGYAWIGGEPDDIAMAALVGREVAAAILAGNTSDMVLPLTEPEPVPYRRLRNLLGLSLLPKPAG